MGVLEGEGMKNQEKSKSNRETHYSERLRKLQNEFTKNQICDANQIDYCTQALFIPGLVSFNNLLPILCTCIFSLINLFFKLFKNCYFKM